jgi:hypothetical protein
MIWVGPGLYVREPSNHTAVKSLPKAKEEAVNCCASLAERLTFAAPAAKELDGFYSGPRESSVRQSQGSLPVCAQMRRTAITSRSLNQVRPRSSRLTHSLITQKIAYKGNFSLTTAQILWQDDPVHSSSTIGEVSGAMANLSFPRSRQPFPDQANPP